MGSPLLGEGRGGRQGEDVAQVVGDGAAGRGAFGGEVAEHAGEFCVAAGAPGQSVDGVDGDTGEEALEDGVPPLVRVEMGGGVRTDGGGDQPGVVGAQGVLDEWKGGGTEVQPVQGEEDGAPFGGGALFVESGHGGQAARASRSSSARTESAYSSPQCRPAAANRSSQGGTA